MVGRSEPWVVSETSVVLNSLVGNFVDSVSDSEDSVVVARSVEVVNSVAVSEISEVVACSIAVGDSVAVEGSVVVARSVVACSNNKTSKRSPCILCPAANIV